MKAHKKFSKIFISKILESQNWSEYNHGIKIKDSQSQENGLM